MKSAGVANFNEMEVLRRQPDKNQIFRIRHKRKIVNGAEPPKNII